MLLIDPDWFKTKSFWKANVESKPKIIKIKIHSDFISYQFEKHLLMWLMNASFIPFFPETLIWLIQHFIIFSTKNNFVKIVNINNWIFNVLIWLLLNFYASNEIFVCLLRKKFLMKKKIDFFKYLLFCFE